MTATHADPLIAEWLAGEEQEHQGAQRRQAAMARMTDAQREALREAATAQDRRRWNTAR